MELLVAMAILSLMCVLLVGISGQATQVWTRGESQNQHRSRARAALELIGREMRQAVVPLDASQTNGLQFVVNPPGISAAYHDSIFWQAPVARNKANGDLAEVGYFIRWTGNQANLCRFYVPSGDTNYLIRNQPDAWITDTLLDSVAPADKASGFQGVFLENVIGLWVAAFAADGTAYADYDSRAHLNHLPAYADISLAFLDTKSAARMNASQAAAIQAASQTATNAETLLGSSALAPLRQGSSASTFRVYFATHE